MGNPGFSAGPVEVTSLAFDGCGTPWVAYMDEISSNKATVMFFPLPQVPLSNWAIALGILLITIFMVIRNWSLIIR